MYKIKLYLTAATMLAVVSQSSAVSRGCVDKVVLLQPGGGGKRRGSSVGKERRYIRKRKLAENRLKSLKSRWIALSGRAIRIEFYTPARD